VAGTASNLADASAGELARVYRERAASPVETVEAVLQRIDLLNERYNAFCLVDREGALAAARQSEARWLRGEPLGPLDGVPATIKDIILTRGWPTLRGSLTIERWQPWDVDAPAPARLREAGAVLVGKTTTPEFGWKGVCDSPLTGVTRNPWNLAMTPGGSSGGAAVAAALRMGCLHIGTDGGGSIRIPSGFSGVFGIKPTFGVVPAFPLSPFGTIAHIGPIAANVADAARALAVISGPDHRDWYALPERSWDFSSELDRGIAGLRIALSPTLGYVDVHPEVRELVEAAGKTLAELGAHVELRDPGFANPFDIFRTIWFTGAANLRRGIPAEKRHLLDTGFNVIADQGEAIGHMDYVGALDDRGALGHYMSVFHQDYDLLITPTLPIPAFEAGRLAPAGVDQTNWMDWTPFSYPFNLTQQPAASIPCGFTSSGLPVGLHIVAAKYRDDIVLRGARAYETRNPIKLPNIDEQRS
jgi:aspartyl-tRNA(Asn)/glutamyl-tRNA(Gln) amidotransferase subunit A